MENFLCSLEMQIEFSIVPPPPLASQSNKVGIIRESRSDPRCSPKSRLWPDLKKKKKFRPPSKGRRAEKSLPRVWINLRQPSPRPTSGLLARINCTGSCPAPRSWSTDSDSAGLGQGPDIWNLKKQWALEVTSLNKQFCTPSPLQQLPKSQNLSFFFYPEIHISIS